MTRWHSLYLLSDDTAAVAERVRTWLQARDYALYDAFGLMPGRAYAYVVRAFAAPPTTGWTRILVEAHAPAEIEQLAAHLSQDALCISAALEADRGGLLTYRAGHPVHNALLADYVRADGSRHQLEQALAGHLTLPPLADTQQISNVSLDDAPDDIKAMAQQVGERQIDRLFGKLAGRLLGASQQQAGMGLLGDDAQPAWSSAAGVQIRGVLDALMLRWRTPDFTTLRQAYQLHRRRQRRPDAPQYPGDDDAMSAVPNALAYQPVYGGKDTL